MNHANQLWPENYCPEIKFGSLMNILNSMYGTNACYYRNTDFKVHIIIL